MAISKVFAELFRSLPLPHGGTLLEIGEANWYGEVPAEFAQADGNRFAACKAFYAATFAPSAICAVDFNGTPAALRHDLNEPLKLDIRTKDVSADYFDVVINHGTAEHVFNIAQVFKTMHDHCADGGLMIHESPFTGWVDHGFYCLQPTLFYDLARANCYEVVLVAIEELTAATLLRLESRDQLYRLNGDLPKNSMLFVCLRKYGDLEFKIPWQGYYSRTLSAEGTRAWEAPR